MEDRELKTIRTQGEATNKLNDRARDVTSWKRELSKELDRLVEVTGKLKESKRELEHAMEQIKRPEEVVMHCMEAREYRVGVDVVNDNVVTALKAEMREIQRIREAMRQHHDVSSASNLHLARNWNAIEDIIMPVQSSRS